MSRSADLCSQVFIPGDSQERSLPNGLVWQLVQARVVNDPRSGIMEVMLDQVMLAIQITVTYAIERRIHCWAELNLCHRFIEALSRSKGS